MTCAPPLVSTSRPSIAPRPTSRATVARVEPKPAVSTSMIDPVGMPATTAVSRLTRTSARNACSLSLMMRNSRSAIAPAAIASNGPAVRVCVQSSGGMVSPSTVVVGCWSGAGEVCGSARAGCDAQVRAGEDLLDDLLGRGGDVESEAGVVVGQGLERGELRRQERRGHEVPAAVLHALAEQLGAAVEVDEADAAVRGPQQVAVGPLER